MSRYYCYVDGGCTNNGQYDAKAMGSYAVYRCEDGVDLTHKMLKELTPFMVDHKFILPFSGTRATNNMAEVTSLFKLLIELNRNKILENDNEIIIYMDSQLTINHFYGVNKITKDYLKKVHANIKHFLDKAYDKAKKKDTGFIIRLEWISGTKMKESVIQH